MVLCHGVRRAAGHLPGGSQTRTSPFRICIPPVFSRPAHAPLREYTVTSIIPIRINHLRGFACLAAADLELEDKPCRHHSNAFRPRGPIEPARSADPGAPPPCQTNPIPFSDSSIFFSLRINHFPGIPLPDPCPSGRNQKTSCTSRIGCDKVAQPRTIEEGWVRGGFPGCCLHPSFGF